MLVLALGIAVEILFVPIVTKRLQRKTRPFRVTPYFKNEVEIVYLEDSLSII